MVTLLWTMVLWGTLGSLLYRRDPLPFATAIWFAVLFAASVISPISALTLFFYWLISIPVAVLLNTPQLRQSMVTSAVFDFLKQVMPSMSATEKEALEAGDIGWEGELFRGRPNWAQFLAYPKPKLSDEEQAFLDGPVQTLCNMVNDWEVSHHELDLPPAVWKFMREEGFFGLMIPKQFGGKGFSAFAHSEIATKLVSTSVTLSTTVSVPNSLGPAELLLEYGTEEQKNHYLPRLAAGLEMPSFALTSPDAGSDASSIPDTGVVCRGQFNGEEVVGLKLNFEKRYITFAPIATVIGLAFKLQDPDKLLSTQVERGITCALIPSNIEGLDVGRRHFPMNIPFQNGPISGKDVFIPLDYIIGGQAQIGRGWQMLMECLSSGRAISLPASGSGGCKAAAYATGAYARIRKQFNCSIGQFSGIQEVLARLGGTAYLTEAARRMTTGLIDTGLRPSVASAIIKYHSTERGQACAKDAMDIHAGKGVCMGPKNYLARGYESAPIAITVEGANILTRCMIIYGQGSIRCHPYVLDEIRATEMKDRQDGLELFDKALLGHVGFTLSNAVRTFALAITQAKLSARKLDVSPQVRPYYQAINRYSAVMALLSDVCMAVFGGELKRREKMSARLGDILSLLYLGSATLKRFRDEGEQVVDLPLVHWAMQDSLFKIQQAIIGILDNLPLRWLARVLTVVIFPLGKSEKAPNDRVDTKVAQLLMTPCATRARLGDNLGVAKNPAHPIYQLDRALEAVVAAEDLEKKLKQAEKAGLLAEAPLQTQIPQAVAASIITEAEAEVILHAHALRQQVIAVDDFSNAELKEMRHESEAYHAEHKQESLRARKNVPKTQQDDKAPGSGKPTVINL